MNFDHSSSSELVAKSNTDSVIPAKWVYSSFSKQVLMNLSFIVLCYKENFIPADLHEDVAKMFPKS